MATTTIETKRCLDHTLPNVCQSINYLWAYKTDLLRTDFSYNISDLGSLPDTANYNWMSTEVTRKEIPHDSCFTGMFG